MARTGRPKTKQRIKKVDEETLLKIISEKEIDVSEIIDAIRLQATEVEIAGGYHMCVSTFRERLVEATGKTFQQLKELCNGPYQLRLRRNQFNLSEKQASMAIFLGKQWLGQSDNPNGITQVITAADYLQAAKNGELTQD